MIQQITLFAGTAMESTANLVAIPKKRVEGVDVPALWALKGVEFGVFDAVASSTSPFTGQTQTQTRPGADWLTAKCTLKPLRSADAAAWKAWLMNMRGMQNAVQLSDPDALTPKGVANGQNSSGAVVSTTPTTNTPMMQSLATRGWLPGVRRLLLPGDAIQIGYRFHYVLDEVDADAQGAATINIFPSLREQPADGTKIVLNHPKALFRLGKNERGWTLRVPLTTDISFSLVEYR